MKRLCVLLSIMLMTAACAKPLRFILVPQQIVVRRDAPMKFDLFLYNDSNGAELVPSLELFRATYRVRRGTNTDAELKSHSRKFSQPIKDHILKAHGVDHATVEIDLSSEEGDYLELSIEVGNDRTLTSNSVILLCPAVAPSETNHSSSPTPPITP